MLGDTAFPQFYPTVFVLVTEMLDNFGELVYARVHAKGAGGKSVADDFTPEQMREEGVETTKNWFYKVWRAIRAQFCAILAQFGAIL